MVYPSERPDVRQAFAHVFGSVGNGLLQFEGIKVMAMREIGKFSLHNGGGFVARGEVAYIDDNGDKKLSGNAGDITVGLTGDIDPAKLGVPNGSVVSLYVFVVLGTDNEAKQSFIYKSGSTVTAKYTITGTTLSNTLGLIAVD